jgi:hypothetical protein
VICEALRNQIEASTPARTDILADADRRVNQRFSLRLAVKCRRIEPHAALDSIILGESLNISSKGLLFKSSEALLTGQAVEAFIDWPMLLDSHIRLTLVVEGVVVRTTDEYAAVRIDRYEFRTRSTTKSRSGARDESPTFLPRPLVLKSRASD